MTEGKEGELFQNMKPRKNAGPLPPAFGRYLPPRPSSTCCVLRTRRGRGPPGASESTEKEVLSDYIPRIGAHTFEKISAPHARAVHLGGDPDWAPELRSGSGNERYSRKGSS